MSQHTNKPDKGCIALENKLTPWLRKAGIDTEATVVRFPDGATQILLKGVDSNSLQLIAHALSDATSGEIITFEPATVRNQKGHPIAGGYLLYEGPPETLLDFGGHSLVEGIKAYTAKDHSSRIDP